MFGIRWRLFRILGIPVSVDLSWLIIFALLTLSFANQFPPLLHEYYPHDTRPLTATDDWIMGLITALAFFTCIVLHEFGHALVARSQGTPISGVTLFLFGGVAELGEEPRTAGSEFLMAIAGPMVSAFLGLAFLCFAEYGYHSGWSHPVVIVLGSLAFINLIVLVFNLIPAFPLDGGRVLRSILWGLTGRLSTATGWAAACGQAFAWLLIAWGVLQFFENQFMNGIWSVFIGFFLNNAARMGYQQVLVRQSLQGEPVRRFMNREPVVVPPSLDLLRWVEDYVYRYHHRAFPVATDGRLDGVVTTEALNQIPRSEWAAHTVGEVLQSDLGPVCISAGSDALEALTKMQRTGSTLLMVTEGERLVGIVSLKDLLNFLNTKLELDGRDGGPAVSRTGGHDRPPGPVLSH